MRVIGISGPDGCGKSTLAEAIQTHAVAKGYPTYIAPFATQLRQELMDVMQAECDRNHPHDTVPNPWEKPTPDFMRNLLRGWGDWKRTMDPDYWVESWVNRLAVLEEQNDNPRLVVVADDVRYENEAMAVTFSGGTVLYLDDASQPDHTLGHELVEVRSMADVGFTINSRAKMWADVDAVLEALDL